MMSLRFQFMPVKVTRTVVAEFKVGGRRASGSASIHEIVGKGLMPYDRCPKNEHYPDGFGIVSPQTTLNLEVVGSYQSYGKLDRLAFFSS